MPFTRDFEAIKNALTLADECDRTNLEVGLVGAAQHILEEWGNGTPCQVLLPEPPSPWTNVMPGKSPTKLIYALSHFVLY